MKKAFILKPSKEWKYCGGGLVILADTFEEAQSLLAQSSEDSDQKLWKTEEEIIVKRGNWDNWVLVATLSCSDEKESRIVLSAWNWA